MAREPVSVILITRNEETNIAECLKSVEWAEEIVVVDSRSTDATVEIAGRFTKKVFVTDWLGYAGAKNYALDKCTQPWVFWIDADERVPDELAKEIKGIVATSTNSYSAYEVARRAYFLGKWIRHCGWYPGYVVRLFRRQGAKFNDAQVHERLLFEGATGRLANDLIHYTDATLEHYLEKMNTYTTLSALQLFKQGRSVSAFSLFLRPAFSFFKMYVLRLGFLDGAAGFTVSYLSSVHVFTKYAKLRQLVLNSRNG
jgi:glycosyltransferase involved in cell wall biosynthesis